MPEAKKKSKISITMTAQPPNQAQPNNQLHGPNPQLRTQNLTTPLYEEYFSLRCKSPFYRSKHGKPNKKPCIPLVVRDLCSNRSRTTKQEDNSTKRTGYYEELLKTMGQFSDPESINISTLSQGEALLVLRLLRQELKSVANADKKIGPKLQIAAVIFALLIVTIITSLILENLS